MLFAFVSVIVSNEAPPTEIWPGENVLLTAGDARTVNVALAATKFGPPLDEMSPTALPTALAGRCHPMNRQRHSGHPEA